MSILINTSPNLNFERITGLDEGLYAQPDIRGMTLKREFRDELGYIAPPNRKLPPVPGSNYSTCDRLKRGINNDFIH